MELDEHGFLIPNFQPEIFSDGLNFNGYFDDNFMPNFFSSSSPIENEFNNYYLNEGVTCLPFGDEFSAFGDEFGGPQMTDSSYNGLDTPPFLVEEEALLPPQPNGLAVEGGCKAEPAVFSVGVWPERKMRGKKMEGQPSKNLMAERRRRKRLNDRLSMLRSIVPKISKMDRTSIVADAIDYVKELLDKINNLKQEMELGSNTDEFNIFKDTKSSEFLVRNSPKFDVERKNDEKTEIEISCSAKPGLLLSTVTTLEALGLEIQHCVISCFHDFALQASCSEELEQRKVKSCEDIKQALFRSAGYGGRCF